MVYMKKLYIIFIALLLVKSKVGMDLDLPLDSYKRDMGTVSKPWFWKCGDIPMGYGNI